MKILILFCALLGVTVGMLIFILYQNEFRLTTKSDDFIVFVSFIFLFISFLIGAVLNFKRLKRDGFIKFRD